MRTLHRLTAYRLELLSIAAALGSLGALLLH